MPPSAPLANTDGVDMNMVQEGEVGGEDDDQQEDDAEEDLMDEVDSFP